jgi:KDO2-lipid IV(A) lauroyltransferase
VSGAYRLLRAVVGGAGLAPLPLARAAGRGLGLLAHRLDRRHREIARANLAASFPERSPAWAAETARACYAHLGQVAAEIPSLLRLSTEQIGRRVRFARPERLEAVRRALDEGRGAFFLTGHIGNWEWLSLAIAREVGPNAIVARPLDWPPADRLVNSWRTATGHEILPKAGSARRILQALRRNMPVGVLLDQNVDWYDGVWVDFFGRPACTNKGLALLALHSRAPVFPIWCWRRADGCFEAHVGEELPLLQSGDKTADVWENTQIYTKALEEIVRQRPEQWFWLHQRWKTKPFQRWPREGG